jgi:hypothetical protein
VRVVRDQGYPAARGDGSPIVTPIVAVVTSRQRRRREPVLLPGMALAPDLPVHRRRPGPATVLICRRQSRRQPACPDDNLRLANFWYAIDLYGALLTMPRARRGRARRRALLVDFFETRIRAERSSAALMENGRRGSRFRIPTEQPEIERPNRCAKETESCAAASSGAWSV